MTNDTIRDIIEARRCVTDARQLVDTASRQLAIAFGRVADDPDVTMEQAAEAVGLSRNTAYQTIERHHPDND